MVEPSINQELYSGWVLIQMLAGCCLFHVIRAQSIADEAITIPSGPWGPIKSPSSSLRGFVDQADRS